MISKSKFQISRALDERIKRIIGGTGEFETEFTNVKSAYILGFNYGNITNCVGLTTNYQLHHAVFPVVGLVFFDSLPSFNEIKSSLTSIRRYSSSPNGLGSFKKDKNEHLFLIYSVDKTNNNHIDKRIFNFTKGTFVRRRRLRLNILDDPFCPRQIHRGSEDFFSHIGDADSMSSGDDDYVDHLIFFIHGVGGVCDVRFRACAEVVADFKKIANNLLAQQSDPSSGTSTPSNNYLAQQLRKGFIRKQSSESSGASRNSDVSEAKLRASMARPRRVEFLPISWHSCTRRQIGMNDQLNMIALGSVPKLRHFLNKVVMDALLYSSGPVYNQTILNNVGDEINRLYTLFMEKHPNFTGTVSLAGHSLGSVILFDLLAHQDPNNHWLNQKQSAEANPETSNLTTEPDSNEQNQFQVDKICRNISHLHKHKDKNLNNDTCSNYASLDELLDDMDLSQYSDTFNREHIDINTLLLLTDLDLKELSLPLGVRRKLGTYINFKKVSNSISMTSKLLNNKSNDRCAQSYTNTHGKESQITNSENIVEENGKGNKDNNTLGCNTTTDKNNVGQYLVKYPQLKFKPKCFFAFGSPMPMFLNIRGIQHISADYKLPTCDRMYNIFHPYDPLAYRLEPLIDARFKTLEPVQVPHFRGGKRIHVQLREGFARVGHDIKHRFFGSLRNTWTSFTRLGHSSPDQSDSPTPIPMQEFKSRPKLTKSASTSVEVEVGTSTDFNHSIRGGHVRGRASSTATTTSSTDKSNDNNRNKTNSSGNNNNNKNKNTNNNNNNGSPASLESSELRPQSMQPSQRHPSVAKSQSEMNVQVLNSIIESSGRKSDDDLNHDENGAHDNDDDNIDIESATNDFDSLNLAAGSGKSRQQFDREGTHSDSADKLSTSTAADGPEEERPFVGNLNGGRRLDYVLQEKPIELFNEYIFAFTSHANYWQNEDSALVILNEIYSQDENEGQLFDDLA